MFLLAAIWSLIEATLCLGVIAVAAQGPHLLESQLIGWLLSLGAFVSVGGASAAAKLNKKEGIEHLEACPVWARILSLCLVSVSVIWIGYLVQATPGGLKSNWGPTFHQYAWNALMANLINSLSLPFLIARARIEGGRRRDGTELRPFGVSHSYGNVTLLGPNQHQVFAWLRGEARDAFVLPARDGFTLVCDKEAENGGPEQMDKLAKRLSSVFSCPAWGVTAVEDGILIYRLYNRGQFVDEYDSAPGCVDYRREKPLDAKADAGKLCELVGRGADLEEVEPLLRAPFLNLSQPKSPLQLHRALLKALGLPSFAAGCGYASLSAGVFPSGIEPSEVRGTEEP